MSPATTRQKYIPAPRYRPGQTVLFMGLRFMIVAVEPEGYVGVCIEDGSAIPKYSITLFEFRTESLLKPFVTN